MVATPLKPFASGVLVGNASIPAEGPKAVPFSADFSVQPQYSIDLLYLYQNRLLSIIQVVWVDNSAGTSEVSLFVTATQQTIKCPAGSQGYYPILSPVQGQMLISGAGDVVNIILINVPMTALGGWAPGAIPAPQFLFTPQGYLKTADQGLAPLIDPALGLLVRSTGGGGGGVLSSQLLCDAIINDGAQHDLFNWNNAAFTLTVTGLRLVLLGGTTAGAIRKPRIYFDSGSTPKTQAFETSTWVPATDKDADIVLFQDYGLNIAIDPTANYGEYQDQTFSGVTGSGFSVQVWGHYTPV